MSEELLIQHCAPTLAGLKTGSLVTAPCPDVPAVLAQLRQWNRRLSPKGVQILPLRFTPGHVLLYLYRSRQLESDLRQRGAAAILRKKGYPDTATGRCLAQLMAHLRQDAEFPHEIGLFLGYPPEDVQGFMENKAARHKLAGCWKVYGDVDAAQQTFARYKKCTRVYLEQWRRGATLERLTVSS